MINIKRMYADPPPLPVACGSAKLKAGASRKGWPVMRGALGVRGNTMFTVTDSTEINRTVQEVFAVAGDYRNDPRWRKGVVAMEHVPAGPPKLGMVTRETMQMLGRRAVFVAEVVEFDDCNRTAFRVIEGPIACEGYRTFEPIGPQTRFTYSATLRPTGFFRMIELLVKPIFKRQVRGDLVRLKGLLEASLQRSDA